MGDGVIREPRRQDGKTARRQERRQSSLPSPNHPNTPTPSSPSPITHHPSPVLALLALGLANLMLAQDLSALNVALPSIERDLDVSLSTVQWVVNAYLLIYGMIIVTGGRLADELGRRRVFLFGAAIFAAGSLLGGLAPHVSWLIAARVLMGVGSGLMLPSITGMAYAVMPKRPELAGGLIVAAYAVGMAIGPMIGGALTEYAGWRWTQFINLPIAALAMIGVWKTVNPAASRSRPDIDYPGIITLSAGLLLFLFGLDQATDWGWTDWRILACLALALASIVAFAFVERRAGPRALVPLEVIRIPGVSLACALKFLMAPAYSAILLYVPQVLQKVWGFSPLEAGIGLLPMLGGYAVISFIAGPLTVRLGLRLAIIAGIASMALGAFLLSGFTIAAGYDGLVAGLLAMGIGLGLFQAAIVTEAVKSDDKDRKSLIGGLVLMFQFVGGAVGLGLTTTIVASSEKAAVNAHLAGAGITLSTAERSALERLLAGAESAQQVLQQFAPADADRLITTASEAFAAGVRSGLRLDAGIVAVGVVLAVAMLGRSRQDGETARIVEESSSRGVEQKTAG